MKSPEELKESLDACFVKKSCAACCYDPEGTCLVDMCMDAKACIEQLEEQIMCMKIQMHGDCGVCKHRSGLKINAWAITMSRTCEECIMQESRPNWEYEGLPELPKKGESA